MQPHRTSTPISAVNGAFSSPAVYPAAPSPSIPNALSKPAKRVSSTCVTCRARKVRCDGRRDVCSNCERLGFKCSYDDSHAGLAGSGNGSDGAGADSQSLLAFPRRRVRQACMNCHSRKARCSGTMPKCDRCRIQGTECVYRPGKRVRPSQHGSNGSISAHVNAKARIEGGAHGSRELSMAMTDAPPGSTAAWVGAGREDRMSSDNARSASEDPADMTSATSPSNYEGPELPPCPDDNPESVTLRAFDNFFRYVFHIPSFSFVHRASLMQRYHSGMADRALIMAIIGITSLLTDMGTGVRQYGDRCVDEAQAVILRELDKPSTLRLQALVFVIKHRMLSKRFSSGFMLMAVASRFAVALRLNHESPRLCFLAQESRRRLMWSLYMIDTGVAGGYDEFSLWASHPERIRIQLPCNERSFEYDLPMAVEMLEPPPPGSDGLVPFVADDIGWLALHVRMHWIRNRVLQYTKRVLANPSHEELVALPSHCGELAAVLTAFADRLPTSFRWAETNVRLRAYSPRLAVFVVTHVWWRQAHCDLFRVALVGLREGLGRQAVATLEGLHPHFVQHCQQQVFEHTKAMSDMMALLLSLGTGRDLLSSSDLDIYVCSYQCVRLLYYILGIPGSESIFGVTNESISQMGNVCLQLLKKGVNLPSAAQAIVDDLDKLVAKGPLSDHGLDSRGMANANQVPTVTANGNPSEPVFSQHSVSQGIVVDEDPEAQPLPIPTSPEDGARPYETDRRYDQRKVSQGLRAPAGSSSVQYSDLQSYSTQMREQLFGPPQPPTPGAVGVAYPFGTSASAGASPTIPPHPPFSPAMQEAQSSMNGGAVDDRNRGTASVAAASHDSNAFEGALDGLDFGAMEPFGMDSMSWVPTEWMTDQFGGNILM